MTISQDLRIRLVKKIATGMWCRQAARYFAVSISSAIRLGKQYRMEESVRARERGIYKRRLDPFGDDILCWIEQTPDLTLQELSQRLSEAHGVRAPKSTIDARLTRGCEDRISASKKPAHASEQERPDVQTARAVWRKR